MSFEWEYPIAVLAHGGGYASLVDDTVEPARHSLVVLSELDRIADVMETLAILGAPKLIKNSREFRWLLESLKAPVDHVAFDINPVGAEANPAFVLSVGELLADHLPSDYSPWNYPVFLLEIEDGFVSITGQRESSDDLHAITVFRSEEKANAYNAAIGGGGSLCEIKNLAEAVSFFKAMKETIDAVALDPIIEDGTCQTPHCFSLDTLLTKYLVEEQPDS
jgi:hypothetical protein